MNIRISKYLSSAGICSRRDAERLIKGGNVTLNKKKISQCNINVTDSDLILVNGKPSKDYFKRKIYSTILEEPLFKTDNLDKLEIFATVSGGGLSGQAGALRHGISRALVNFDPSLRKKLKKAGFLTRDARKVERKKFGKHKARRSPQFSKR